MASFANEKEQAHRLIEHLAPSQVSAIVNVLQAMLDPVAKAIATAPFDDEQETAEEKAAVTKSKDWFQKQEGLTSEQIMAELGLDHKQGNSKA